MTIFQNRYARWLGKLADISLRQSAAYGYWNFSFNTLYHSTQVKLFPPLNTGVSFFSFVPSIFFPWLINEELSLKERHLKNRELYVLKTNVIQKLNITGNAFSKINLNLLRRKMIDGFSERSFTWKPHSSLALASQHLDIVTPHYSALCII